MSHEQSPYTPYPLAVHRKLSAYLLRRESFGIENGRPNDGYYFREGLLTISDYLTMCSKNRAYASPDLDSRKTALRLGKSILDAQVENGPSVILFRPRNLDRIRSLSIPQLFALQDSDWYRTDVIMLDSQEGVVLQPERHPISPYFDNLPDIAG